MPGVPSFLIPLSADARPRADGPPVADPRIDMADDSPWFCEVDAAANACWKADIVCKCIDEVYV
jgi:hypothetical protein